MVHLIPHGSMTNPLPNSTPAPSSWLLDLNLNMSLNPETPMHDDILHELVLFIPIRQIKGSHAMFKVTSFVYVWPYLQLFDSLEGNIHQLRVPLMDVMTNPRHKCMEADLSNVTDWVPLWGIAVSFETCFYKHIKKFCTLPKYLH